MQAHDCLKPQLFPFPLCLSGNHKKPQRWFRVRANYSSWVKSGPLPVFISSFIETEANPFVTVLSTTAFTLQLQSWLVETETGWPKSLHDSLSDPWLKKFTTSFIQRVDLYWYCPVGALLDGAKRGSKMLDLSHFTPSSTPTRNLGSQAMDLTFFPIYLTPGSFTSKQKRPSTEEWKQFRKEDLHRNCMCECSWNLPVVHIAILEVFYLPSKELRNLMATNITTRPISVPPQTKRV